MSARFRITIDRGSRRPIALVDRSTPAHVHNFRTFDAAMLFADNRVRAERRMPHRIEISTDELVAAIRAARAFNKSGLHSHMFGEPSDGCAACEPIADPRDQFDIAAELAR